MEYARNKYAVNEDFTPEEHIPVDGSFNRLAQPGGSSTLTPEEKSMQGMQRDPQEELKRSKIDDLYKHLEIELGLPNAWHYDDFQSRAPLCRKNLTERRIAISQCDKAGARDKTLAGYMVHGVYYAEQGKPSHDSETPK